MNLKTVFLVGGGHSNIQVLHRLGKIKKRQFQLTLFSDVQFAPYSGMIPAYLAGDWNLDDLHFDLKKICDRYGFSFIQQKVSKISASQNQIQLHNGEIHHYDICSVNIGIQPVTLPISPSAAHKTLTVKPISEFLRKWNEVQMKLFRDPEFHSLNIIGGGAAAFEIAIACRRKFPNPMYPIRLLAGRRGLLSHTNSRTRKLAKRSLEFHKIETVESSHVIEITDEGIVLEDGRLLQSSLALICTSASAPELFKRSELPIDENGFLKVNESLQVPGFENLFAAGDCVRFLPRPLPKAGVFAVRQGPVLEQNIVASIDGKNSKTTYVPQSRHLSLLVSGHHQAIASYGDIALVGLLPWKLKQMLDLSFMKRFQ